MDKKLYRTLLIEGIIGIGIAYFVMIFIRFPCQEMKCLVNFGATSSLLVGLLTSFIVVLTLLVGFVGHFIRRNSGNVSEQGKKERYGLKIIAVTVVVILLTILIPILQNTFFYPTHY